MDVLKGLKHAEGSNYNKGKIIDPLTGNIYSMKAKLSNNGKRLTLEVTSVFLHLDAVKHGFETTNSFLIL